MAKGSATGAKGTKKSNPQIIDDTPSPTSQSLDTIMADQAEKKAAAKKKKSPEPEPRKPKQVLASNTTSTPARVTAKSYPSATITAAQAEAQVTAVGVPAVNSVEEYDPQATNDESTIPTYTPTPPPTVPHHVPNLG